MTRSVAEWTAHWDAKAEIENPIEINGYCVEGVAIDAETYLRVVVEPCLALLELAPDQHVLEIGCGTGLILRELEKSVTRAVGTDPSRVLLARYAGNAETIVCAAHELPFRGEQFDRIVLHSVVHYFPDFAYFAGVVRHLVSLLRTPGILLLGDVPIGPQPPDTPYLWYDRRDLADVFEPMGLPFSICAQSREKRALNSRYDIVVYKD